MIKVLIVEDDRITALDLKTHLELKNYRVVEIASGRDEALQAVKKTHPDIVLMDIYLEKSSNGIDIAREIREEMDVPVIFLTASSDSTTLEMAKTANAYGYIIKPFDEINICAAIEIALYKHGIEKKLQNEIIERKKAEEKLTYRMELEKLISSISSRFINLPAAEIDAEITISLEAIGRFTGSDKAYIFLLSNKSEAVSITHEWCAEGITSIRDLFQNVRVDRSPNWAKKIRHLEYVHIPDTGLMTEEMHAEKKILLDLGIKSLLYVPMAFGQKIMGFLGFTTSKKYREWTDEDISLLKTAAHIFSAALEYRKTLERLTVSELRFRSLFEGSIDGIMFLDENENFVDCNKSFLAMTGYRPDEIKKKNLQDITPKKWHQWEKDEILNKKILTDGFSGTYQKEYIKNDGTVFPVESTLYRVDLGRKKFFLWGVSKDITERKIIEISLNDQIHFLQTLLDTVPIPVFYKNRMGIYTGCNKAFETFLGRKRDDIIGKNVFEIGPEDITTKYFEKDEELFNNPESVQIYKWKIQNSANEVKDVLFYKAAFFDSGGDIAGIIGAIYDITDRKNPGKPS